MKIKIIALAAVLLSVMFGSCSQKIDMVYFNNIDSLKVQSIKEDYALRIKPDDELVITVTSAVPEATAMYNLPAVNGMSRGETTISSQGQLQTYSVDSNGDIDFPMIGKVRVKGLTTNQVEDLLTEKISQSVKDPMVNVDFKGYRVVVLGEVNSRGTHRVTNQRYSILDAIGDAGDLTIYGRRDNVLVIREENGKTQTYRVDLRDAKMMTSPVYYLQQNDVVYVEPNDVRRSNAAYNSDNAYKLQVVSSVVSALSVIASLVIALVVK